MHSDLADERKTNLNKCEVKLVPHPSFNERTQMRLLQVSAARDLGSARQHDAVIVQQTLGTHVLFRRRRRVVFARVKQAADLMDPSLKEHPTKHWMMMPVNTLRSPKSFGEKQNQPCSNRNGPRARQ